MTERTAADIASSRNGLPDSQPDPSGRLRALARLPGGLVAASRCTCTDAVRLLGGDWLERGYGEIASRNLSLTAN
jgi:hypothetical protein